jgi:hypothetical protein
MPMPVQIPHLLTTPAANAPQPAQHQNSPKRTVQQQPNSNNFKQNINQKQAPSSHNQPLSAGSRIPTGSHPQFNQITRVTTTNNCDMQQSAATLQHKFGTRAKENVYESLKQSEYHIYEQIDHSKRTNNLNRPKFLTNQQQQQQMAAPVHQNLTHQIPMFNQELLRYFQGQMVQNLSPIDERGSTLLPKPEQLGVSLMMETAAYVER